MSLFGLRKGKHPELHERRRQERVLCLERVECKESSGLLIDCMIVNISERGLGLKCHNSLILNDKVSFISPAIEAVVIWTLDNKAGLGIIR